MRYFFACDFLWWAFHVYFRPLKGIETGDLAERVGEFDYYLEDVGEWLIVQGEKAGRAFRKNDTLVSIFHIDDGKEERALGWIRTIETMCQDLARDPSNYDYCLYYLENVWIHTVIARFEALIRSLNAPDLLDSFEQTRNLFDTLAAWLQNERRDIAQTYLPPDQRKAIDHAAEQMNAHLISDWDKIVYLYTQRHASA
jgi:hypothetical protein